MSIAPAVEGSGGEAAVPRSAGPGAMSAGRPAAASGPWQPRLVDTREGQHAAEESPGDRPSKGGASDLHRR
jgi:hypothetical protein